MSQVITGQVDVIRVQRPAEVGAIAFAIDPGSLFRIAQLQEILDDLRRKITAG